MPNPMEVMQKGMKEKEAAKKMKKMNKNQFAEGADMQHFKADPAIVAEAKAQAAKDKK